MSCMIEFINQVVHDYMTEQIFSSIGIIINNFHRNPGKGVD